MERVTINIEEAALRLVKERAEESGESLSAYVAAAAHQRALAEQYAAAAAAEAEYPPTETDLRADAARIAAKHADRPGMVTGAA